MTNHLRRIATTPLVLATLPWLALYAWVQQDRYRSSHREVSTGVYIGMAEALRRQPELTAAMRSALKDDRVENREFLPILDRTTEFAVPTADHWNPAAQAAARRRLQAVLDRKG